jgi:hypothetical protein
MRAYFWNVLIAIDQFLNAITGGDPDETISSRAGKRRQSHKWACYLCKFLNWLDTNHCKKSIELDEGSKALDK